MLYIILTISEGSMRGCFTWRSSSFSEFFLLRALKIAGFVLEDSAPFLCLKQTMQALLP